MAATRHRGEKKTRARPPATPPSPAQIAARVTFALKGDLKNVQLSYLRASVRLARVRAERLWEALGHASIEEYAQERLGLQRAALYRYLQAHDWALKRHPDWLKPHPKGFIPELSDVAALMWIDHRLEDDRLPAATRRTLEDMQHKAEAGQLTEREFRTLRGDARNEPADGDDAVLKTLRNLRRTAARRPRLGRAVLEALDAAIEAVERALHAGATIAAVSARRVKPATMH